MPSNGLYCVIQDVKGYIWISSEKGISKFDGNKFKNFTVADGLPTNDIWRMTEDLQGRIWLHCFGNRLSYIENDSVVHIEHDPNEPLYIRHINIDTAGVWFNSSKLHEVKGETLVELNDLVYQQVERENEQLLYGRVAGIKWFSKSKGIISYFNRRKLEFYKIYEVDKDGKETSLHPKLDKVLKEQISPLYEVFETKNALIFQVSDKMIVWLKNEEEVKIIDPKTFFPGYDGSEIALQFYGEKMMIRVPKGFLEYDENFNLKDVFYPKKLNEKSKLGAFCKDKEGNIWIPTRSKGLYFLPAKSRNALTFNPPRSEAKVTSIAASGDVIAWGTQKTKAYFLENDTIKKLENLSDTEVALQIMATDNKGCFLMSAAPNLYFVNKNNLSNPKELLSSYEVVIEPGNYPMHGFLDYQREIIKDRKGGFLMANNYSCLRVKISNDTIFVNVLDLYTARAHTLALDKKDKVWLGGPKGLWWVKNEEKNLLFEKNEMFKFQVYDLKVDSRNRIWVAAEGVGAYIVENEKPKAIKALKNDFVADLFIEGDSICWAATVRGLKKLRITSEPSESYLLKTYTRQSGLASLEVNKIWVTDQYIYAGTNEGLTRIEKEPNLLEKSNPPVYLTDLMVKGVSMDFSQSITLKYFQNELEVEFVSLDYGSVGDITYSYRLVGADDHWQTTQIPKVRYAGLPPNQYKFQLKVKDSEGNTTEASQFFEVVILPPWWQTGWFRFLFIILLVSAIYWLYKYRIKQVEEEEATKSVVQKKFAELELQALRSQMNPHFVFNSLGAIQYYIRENMQRDANDYLSKFASLMRLFLDSSREKYISIEDELKLIGLYVELEQMRFEDRFEVNFEIDKDLQMDSIYLPSMLLQPFVENAINHGLFNKEEKGNLCLKVYSSDDVDKIVVVIEDDGVGRKMANEIKAKSIKNYKSRSTQIVDERLAVLEKVEDFKIKIKIEDVFPEKIETGTRVTIELPLID